MDRGVTAGGKQERGGVSIMLASREEPHLLSQAGEVSLSLFALRTQIGFLPGAPGPSVSASPAGRARCGSRSPGTQSGCPGRDRSPTFFELGQGEDGKAGEVELRD